MPAQIVSVDLSIDSASPSSPRRKIFTAADLEPWFASRAYADLEAYTLELCHSVVGKKVDDECFESEVSPLRYALHFPRMPFDLTQILE